MPAAPQPPVETAADRQIARAEQLEYDRADIMKRIGKNREYLRLMNENEELTADDSAWLVVWYAEKEKGVKRSADDITATRALKAEARKRIAIELGVEPPEVDEDDDDDGDDS